MRCKPARGPAKASAPDRPASASAESARTRLENLVSQFTGMCRCSVATTDVCSDAALAPVHQSGPNSDGKSGVTIFVT